MVALPPRVGGLTPAPMPLGPDGFPLPPPSSGNKIVDEQVMKMYNEKKQEFLAQKAREAARATPAPIAPAPVLEAAPQLSVKEKRKPKLPSNEPPYEVQHQIIQVGEHVWEFTHKGKLTFPDGSQQLTAALGISPTQIQNSITLGAITTAPAAAKRTVERIESQVIGDKVRLTYKLGQVSSAAGNGHYLLSLPTGMSFNQTYNPVYTGAEWAGGVNALAPYHIPAVGGIVIDGNWNNQVMVVPYDSTRFRVLFSNNNSQTTYGFWHSGWYATSAGSGISLNLQFEIWK